MYKIAVYSGQQVKVRNSYGVITPRREGGTPQIFWHGYFSPQYLKLLTQQDLMMLKKELDRYVNTNKMS